MVTALWASDTTPNILSGNRVWVGKGKNCMVRLYIDDIFFSTITIILQALKC